MLMLNIAFVVRGGYILPLSALRSHDQKIAISTVGFRRDPEFDEAFTSPVLQACWWTFLEAGVPH